MDRKNILHKSKTIDVQDQIGSSSFGSRNQKSEKKKRLKEKERHCHKDLGNEGGTTLWKNFSSIFNKNNNKKFEVFKSKTSQASSSFFKHPKKSTRLNVRNKSVEDDEDLAMAIRLPAGTAIENVSVNIQLEMIKKKEISQSFNDVDDCIVMKPFKESESLSVFTGLLRLPSDTDISTIVDMPLYLIDSNEELILTPATELPCKKRIRPSEEMLLNEDNTPVMVSDIKVTLQLNKAKKTGESLLEVREEIGKVVEEITEDIFKKFEGKVSGSIVQGLFNDEIEGAPRRDDQGDLKEQMRSYLDELLAERVFGKYAGLPKVSVLKNSKIKEKLKKRILVKKAKVASFDRQESESWKDSSEFKSKRKGNTSFLQKMKELCKRLNLTLDDSEMEAAIREIWGSEMEMDPKRDTFTQYSATNLCNTSDVQIQSSSCLYNDGCEWHSLPVTDSQILLLSHFKSSSTEPLTQRSSKSSESVLPSLPFDKSNIADDAVSCRVPSNTPSSCIELHLNVRKSSSITENDSHDEIGKITVTYKEKDSKLNDITLTIIDPYKFGNLFSPKNKKIVTQCKTGNDKNTDKTLNLLQCAKCKLIKHLQNQNLLKQDYSDLACTNTLNNNGQDEKHICTACIGHSCEAHQIKNTLPDNNPNSRLLGEFNSLQNEFVAMCENMKVLFNTTEVAFPTLPDLSKKLVESSGKIEQIEEDLTNTFSELTSCLSTIGQTLEETLTVMDPDDDNSELSSDRHKTYFAMETEIKRTIKELLNESEGIRETIILNGGKKEDDPPFSCEEVVVDSTYDMCRDILTDILECTVSKGLHDEALADIEYIMKIILDEVDKKSSLLNKLKKLTVCKNETINVDAGKSLNCTNLQSGDVDGPSNHQVFGGINNPVIYFQNSFSLNSRIPKTSFSFGESLTTCVEIPSSSCKTPVRHRDGLTVMDTSSPRVLETSRLFNELINFQSGFDQLKKCDSELVVKDQIKTILIPTVEESQDLLTNITSCEPYNVPEIVLYNLTRSKEGMETNENEFIHADESPCLSCKDDLKTNHINESVKPVVDSSAQTSMSLKSSDSSTDDDECCCCGNPNSECSACSCCNDTKPLESTSNEEYCIPDGAKKYILNHKISESSATASSSSEYSNICTMCEAFQNLIKNEILQETMQDNLDVSGSSLNPHLPIKEDTIINEQACISERCTSGVSTQNSTTLQNQEITQKSIPPPPPMNDVFKSIQELNTPEEIAEIEKNVKENSHLEELAKTAFTECPAVQSISSTISQEIAVVNIDTPV